MNYISKDRIQECFNDLNYYRDELVKNNLKFFLVSGSKEARLRKSILKINEFISLNKKDTYSIKATDRANELLLYIHNLFLKGYFNNEFKNNFYKSKIRHKENDTRIEINFTNINGVLNV